ncbi:hypothetical protein GCM10010411_75220 [Actinomadura fulvescens]|uniref:Uncharacterized protein n=1 Tax=Actinomadura fulvescens TaxID=46160 RepID=A0ABP6CUW6_9ACTN
MESHGSRTITIENGDQVLVERDPQPLPLPDPKELTALKRKLNDNPHVNLTKPAIETAVGLFIDLPRVIRMATFEAGIDGLSSQYAGASHLYFLEGEADAAAPSFVLGNPRLDYLLRGLPNAPRRSGARDETGRLQAQLIVEFDSVADAESLVEATVKQTLNDPGADYSDSIIGHGVMTPVEAVLAEVRFTNGSPPLFLTALYDGTSRAASAALVRYYQADLTPAENIALTARELRNALTMTARKRRTAYLRQAEAANLAYQRPDGLTMPVLRQLQARRLPVRLIVGADFSQDNTNELPAAITAAQSTRHISVNPWREASKDSVTAQRTVQHLYQAGHVSEAFIHLAENRPLTDGEIAKLFPGADRDLVVDPRTGRARPLWRAAEIVHTLTEPGVDDEARLFIRGDQGVRSIQPERYAGFIGVLVDVPWRWTKPETTDTARNAWRNGGVLSPEIFEEWDEGPVYEHVDELINRAEVGDTAARLTLQVLAGTALLADGILTRDRGSKLGADGVTYRAAPPVLLSTWADTRHGRLQAGQVIRTFDHTRAGGPGTGRTTGAAYTYYLVDDTGRSVQSGQGVTTLLEGHLFDQADPERAAEGRRLLRAEQQGTTLSREERNEHRRSTVNDLIGRAAAAVEQLKGEVPDYPAKLTEHPFGRKADWKLLIDKARELGDALLLHSPPADPEPPLFDDGDDE